MKNLRELWGARFFNYMTEFQKYMKYVFTGHLAIVLVFAIGAAGYAYSEWLKDIPTNFPSLLIVSVFIAAALTYSPPITLLKPADAVYLLPLETKLKGYLSKALGWSVFSQLPLPYIFFIIALPLLSATDIGSKVAFIWLALFIFAIKWLYVEVEYFVRHALSGAHIWRDRLFRFVLASLFIYLWFTAYFYLVFGIAIMLGIYANYWRNAKDKKPFPYDHFIALEQNRMMRFYRFANYFTDVPHLKGSISRRAWLGFLMGSPKFGQAESQAFLVRRTFIRTDDIFWLWLRLTAISMLGALFISFPIVVVLFVGALTFASSIQLVYALRAGDEFRMDMLFPVKGNTRPNAIRKTVRTVQWIQALLVIISAFFLFGLSSTPLILFFVMIVVSELTIRLIKENK